MPPTTQKRCRSLGLLGSFQKCAGRVPDLEHHELHLWPIVMSGAGRPGRLISTYPCTSQAEGGEQIT